jgi:hypothetical protein
MQTFLNQPEATFYHITTERNWEEIKQKGLNNDEGKIFVSRVGELPVLLGIMMLQLPEIYDNDDNIAFLKIPQVLNQFTINDIVPDHQAHGLWTQPYHNIICKKHIPPQNIELMMIFKFKDPEHKSFLFTFFNNIETPSSQDYPNHVITKRSKNLKYAKQRC